jgi:hypothetical protein
VRRLLAVLPVLALLAACGGNDDKPGGGSAAAPEPSPSRSLYTLTPIPLPADPPPSGKLIADIEQSTRDTAANRFEVWIDNDTDATILPTAITYHDVRFHSDVPGTRLREIPSQSRRGFQFTIPDQPACGQTQGSGTVTVDYTVAGAHKSSTVPTEDEATVVGRVASSRCLELSIARVAQLTWDDEVTASGDGGKGSVGTMFLDVDTTGQRGSTLVIDTITGNPVLSPGDHGVYQANLTITGDQQSQQVPIQLLPTRCDAHAFAAAGNYGAFALNVHVDGKPGQIILQMGVTAAANAVAYARASCGFLTTGEEAN